MSVTQSPEILLPPEAVWSAGFDSARATDAYLATVPAADRAKSDAYFEGGYWIEAWSTLITVALAWLMLRARFGARLRDFAERRTRGPFLQAFIVALAFLVVLAIALLPWEMYVNFFREHQYGMSNHTPGDYLGEWLIGTALFSLVASLAIAGIYALVRKLRERWVWWATGVTAVFMLFMVLIEPVFVAPLFNDYQSLPDGEVRESILALAEETQIEANDVFWFDASRQTKRISANVSGIGGTMRIALNDNLLNGTTLPEILAVMGHEMGHYRLRHAWWGTIELAVVFGFAYWVVNRTFGRFQRRYGERWGVRDLADPAGLPLVLAIFVAVVYLLSPVTNTISRVAEHQADAFGLEAAQEPHGFASIAMRLSTYRKLEPSALEEIIFFDHPSGRARVERAMSWLAEHPPAK
jgi:STE24 endopeptidase